MNINVKLIAVIILLGTSSAIAEYQTEVVSGDGYRTAIMGTGKDVNKYIANKIKVAESGDTIRLGYYILDYTARGKGQTKYFHNAIVNALKNGAKVEIITEGKNTDLEALRNNKIKASRYRNANEFLYGDENDKEDGFIINLTSLRNEQDLDLRRNEENIKRYNSNLTIYKVDRAGDSEKPNAIYHRKVALLDIDNKKEIIISTANVRYGGETAWQAAISLQEENYPGQWEWWNKVLDTDKCFATLGNKHKECRLGNGGYEYFKEGWTTSFVSDKTTYNTMATDWLKKMDKPHNNTCNLSMLMGEVSNIVVIKKLTEIAKKGCTVNFIYNKDYNKGQNKIEKIVAKEMKAHKYQNKITIMMNKHLHAKMILWNGKYSSMPEKTIKLSWVGSMNATTIGITEHDETMLRIKGNKLHDAFKKYFEDVKSDNNTSVIYP